MKKRYQQQPQLWPEKQRERVKVTCPVLSMGHNTMSLALAGDIVLCSWARHLTLTVPLSTQVYKWVPVNLMLGGNPAMD